MLVPCPSTNDIEENVVDYASWFLRYRIGLRRILNKTRTLNSLMPIARWFLIVTGCTCCFAQLTATTPKLPPAKSSSGFKLHIEHNMSLGLSVRKDGVSTPITSSVSAELSFGETRSLPLRTNEAPMKDSLAIWHIKDLTMMIGEIDSIAVSCESAHQVISNDREADQRSVQEEVDSVRKHLRAELAALIKESRLQTQSAGQLSLAPNVSFPHTDIELPSAVRSGDCEVCKGRRSLWTRGIRLTTNLRTVSNSASSLFTSTRTSITAGLSLSLNRQPFDRNQEGTSTTKHYTTRQNSLSRAIGRFQTDERVIFLRDRIDQLRRELRSEACNSSEHSKWLHEKYVLYLVEFYHAKRSIIDSALDPAQLH
jgi:hypothetical protein